MRAWLLSMLLLATPAFAEAPAPIVVAPAGSCAEDDANRAPRALPKPPADEPAPLEAGVLHLSPADVASNAALAGLPLPAPAAFEGPGACDNPGSGCAGARIVEDPDPGTGCGFPGSGCP
jgi:hypothetical protein